MQAEEDLDPEEREDGDRFLGAGGPQDARGARQGARGLLDPGARRPPGRCNRFPQSGAFRRRSALPMTETELRLIAALAIIGLSTIPRTG